MNFGSFRFAEKNTSERIHLASLESSQVLLERIKCWKEGKSAKHLIEIHTKSWKLIDKCNNLIPETNNDGNLTKR